MPIFDVTLTAQAQVAATIRGIEAGSPEAAERKAFELYGSGEASFHIYNVDEATVNPSLVTLSKLQTREYEAPVDFR